LFNTNFISLYEMQLYCSVCDTIGTQVYWAISRRPQDKTEVMPIIIDTRDF